MGLIVNVTPTKVEITNKDAFTINQGEYNINNCTFTFSQEYAGLVKRVVFQNLLDNKYYVEINEDNECIIPEIMLRLSGSIYLKVFAYENNSDGTLNLRYSPTPDTFDVNPGSYTPTAYAVLAPEVAKDLIDKVNELLEEADEAIDRVNSIRFEIDSKGYLILTEND